MKLPRDLGGDDLARRLSVLGYRVARQTGNHIRLTTDRRGEHHLTIPRHNPLKIGTLNSILRAIGGHHQMDREQLVKTLLRMNP